MPDPASTTLAAPRLALGAGAADYDAAVERARTDEWANRLFARDVRLWSSDPRVGEAIAERLGWLDAPAHFAERIAGARGVRRRGRRRGLHDGRRRRDGRQQPRPRRPPSDVRHPRRLSRPAHPRLDRPGLRVGDARRPRSAPDARHHRLQVGHDHRAERLPRLRLGARRGGARGRPAPRATRHAGRVLRGHHRPGQERRGDRPPDDFREVFTQPARHRRPLLGADLRRARAGVAHRHRPRRRCSRRPRRCSAPAASRTRRSTRASRSAWPSGPWPRPAATS